MIANLIVAGVSILLFGSCCKDYFEAMEEVL